MIYIVLIIFFITTNNLFSDMPGRALQYVRYSENEAFYYNSIPYDYYDVTKFGKTIVFDSKTNKQLYETDIYLSYDCFISNDGKTLVSSESWMCHHVVNCEDMSLIEIHINGKEPIIYILKDLFFNKKKLKHTSSHTIWYEKMYVKNDTLNILTYEDILVQIELKSGAIINRIQVDPIKIKKETENYEYPKTIYDTSIVYPEKYFVPNLKEGKNFKKSLVSYLNKQEFKECNDCDYIYIFVIINLEGICESVYVDIDYKVNLNTDYKNKIEDWIKKQKFNVDSIPKNCEKWIFTEIMYLK